MGVMRDAIGNGFGVGGVADKVVPRVGGQLACDDERLACVTLLQEFQKIMAGAGVGQGEPPIVKDEDIGSAEAA